MWRKGNAVMLELSKEQIRRLAIDDSTYNRGVRYYKSKAVTNVTWSKGLRQYQAIVHGGNDYRVTIRLNNDGDDFHYNCNCPAKVKYQGACKHVIAMLLFLSDYLRMTKEKPQDKEDMAAFRINHYFEKHEELPVYGETFDIAVTFYLTENMQQKLKQGDIFAQASIQVGAGKLYRIQNLKKFLEGLSKKQEIKIGKRFCYIPEESSFTRNAAEILEFLQEIYEIQEGDGKSYFSRLFSKAQVSLTEPMFARLMKIMEGQQFTLELLHEDGTIDSFEHITFWQGNPKVSFEILETEEELYVTYKEKSDLTALAGNKHYFFNGETIFFPTKQFLKTFLPFYSELQKQETILFRGQHKERFISNVLIHLYEQMELTLPETLKDRYIRETLAARCYLEREGIDISLKLEFHYGVHKINPLLPYEGGFLVIREKEKEQELLNFIGQLSFFPYRDRFILRKEEKIYFFLTEGCKELSRYCDVFYEDSIRSLKCNATLQYHTYLRINKEQNLLEMQFASDELEADDLRELFYSIKVKKKFHRLKNGNFINLADEDVGELQNFLESLNVSWQEIKNNTILVKKQQAFYLDSIILGENVEKSPDFCQYIQGLLAPEKKEELPKIPKIITAKLREYQREGFAWLKRLARYSLGGILADDMGLGKTLQAITYICDRMESFEPEKEQKMLFLIVCPTSLVYNWKEEFERFAPKVVTKIVEGIPQERKAVLESLENKEVVITSYPLVRRDIEAYHTISFDTMFLDEAQYIKNPGSLSARMVKQISALHRFALTGTPIENSLGELWSIFNFIMPDYLPKYSKFQRLYEKPIVGEKDEKALHDLEKHIQPFLLRRMKKEVLHELPDKIEMKYNAEMTEKQKKLYQSYLITLKEQIYGNQEEEIPIWQVQEMPIELIEQKELPGMPNRMMVLSALTRLRQICCHPSSFLENYDGGSGKYNLLMEELLPDLLAGGHRILIFSQFTSMLELIAEGLKKQNMTYYRLDGATKVSERKRQVEEFNLGGRPIFLISLMAGGTGLNLTGADTVIHFDPWWNPAVEEQAEDRAYRIGQKKNVQVIRLITQGTIEEKIYEMQKQKQELTDTVISAKDIKELFAITGESLGINS